MIILVDIGNSNVVIAQYVDKLNRTYRFNTDKHKSIDEYYVMLRTILDGATGMIVSSVVPELNVIFKNIAQEYLNIEAMFIGPGVKTGVQINIDNPKELGTDMVADAAGAFAHYAETAIIVDMGTATTVSYVDNKVIKGVSISAGLVTQKDAIVSNASQLSQFEFKHPKSAVGTNSIDSLNAGLLLGHKYMIEGIINHMKREYNSNPTVLITGGASRFVEGLLDPTYIFDDLLLIKGLLSIYQKNKK